MHTYVCDMCIHTYQKFETNQKKNAQNKYFIQNEKKNVNYQNGLTFINIYTNVE